MPFSCAAGSYGSEGKLPYNCALELAAKQVFSRRHGVELAHYRQRNYSFTANKTKNVHSARRTRMTVSKIAIWSLTSIESAKSRFIASSLWWSNGEITKTYCSEEIRGSLPAGFPVVIRTRSFLRYRWYAVALPTTRRNFEAICMLFCGGS